MEHGRGRRRARRASRFSAQRAINERDSRRITMMVVTLLTFLSRQAQARPVCRVPTPRARAHRLVSPLASRLSVVVLIAIAALRLTSATAAEARHAIAMHGEPAL